MQEWNMYYCGCNAEVYLCKVHFWITTKQFLEENQNLIERYKQVTYERVSATKVLLILYNKKENEDPYIGEYDEHGVEFK